MLTKNTIFFQIECLYFFPFIALNLTGMENFKESLHVNGVTSERLKGLNLQHESLQFICSYVEHRAPSKRSSYELKQ